MGVLVYSLLWVMQYLYHQPPVLGPSGFGLHLWGRLGRLLSGYGQFSKLVIMGLGFRV